jgi:hypothetical protein
MVKGHEMDDPIEKLPLDMELDLLVDEELPEERRRELLKSLDNRPGQWRELSIRFLQRQVEKKSARQLLAAGVVNLPGREEKPAGYFRFPRGSWLSQARMTGIAAALLIAAGAGVMIYSVMQHDARTNVIVQNHDVSPVDPMTVDTNLPRSVAGMEIPVKVSVVDLRTDAQASTIFQQDFDARPGSRQSIVIKPDASGNALVIPVKSLQVQ